MLRMYYVTEHPDICTMHFELCKVNRLLAVPFWIAEGESEVAERKSRNLERTRGGGLVFSRFFSSLQSRRAVHSSRLLLALSTIHKEIASSL